MNTFSYYYPPDTEVLSSSDQTLDADVPTSLYPGSRMAEALLFDRSEPSQAGALSLTLEFCGLFVDLFRDMLTDFQVDGQSPPPFGALAHDARVRSDYRIGSTESNGVEVWTSYYIDVDLFKELLVQLQIEYCRHYNRRGKLADMGIWEYEIFFKVGEGSGVPGETTPAQPSNGDLVRPDNIVYQDTEPSMEEYTQTVFNPEDVRETQTISIAVIGRKLSEKQKRGSSAGSGGISTPRGMDRMLLVLDPIEPQIPLRLSIITATAEQERGMPADSAVISTPKNRKKQIKKNQKSKHNFIDVRIKVNNSKRCKEIKPWSTMVSKLARVQPQSPGVPVASTIVGGSYCGDLSAPPFTSESPIMFRIDSDK